MNKNYESNKSEITIKPEKFSTSKYSNYKNRKCKNKYGNWTFTGRYMEKIKIMGEN
jgi:hypothetical protein